MMMKNGRKWHYDGTARRLTATIKGKQCNVIF
jgi:hypothetical protein